MQYQLNDSWYLLGEFGFGDRQSLFSLSIDVFNQSSAMKTNTLIFLITLGFSLLAEASDNVLDKVLEKLGASETVDVSKTIDWGYSWTIC